MSGIKSIDGLYHALGDSGLLTDYRSDRTKVILYLQALIDEAQVYMDTYPKVEEGTLSERAVLSLAQIRDLRDTDPEGVVDKNDRYYYARSVKRRYDDVMQDHPIYQKLKDFATVPAAYVFRIKPGGDGYLQEAKKNAGLLPGFRSEQIQGDL